LKLVIIIAIAVFGPFVAVIGVVEGGDFLLQILMEPKEQPIVDAYNQEMKRCRMASAEEGCESNAFQKFKIWELSERSYQKLESSYYEEGVKVHLEKPRSMQEILGDFTGMINYFEGCGNRAGCMGPSGPGIAIFGSELPYLFFHMISSIILGFVIFRILSSLKKRDKIKIPRYLMIIVSVIDAVLLFFVFAYLFPMHVLY